MPWNSSDLDTLNVTAYFPYTKTPVWEDAIAAFPSTMEQRLSHQTQAIYLHELGLANLTDDQAIDLIDFFNSHNGRMIPFKWTDPTGTLVYVRFNQKSLPMQKRLPNNWSLSGSLSLREVHASEIIIDD